MIGPRVLIVDDDPIFVELMVELLEVGGYQPTVCPSAARCPDLAARLLPAVIVLDLIMPEVSGWRVLEALRQRPETAATPVIVTTAATLTADELIRLQDLEATTVIFKPFDLSEFLRVLERLLPSTRGQSLTSHA